MGEKKSGIPVSIATDCGKYPDGKWAFTIAAYLQVFQAANAGPMANTEAAGGSGRFWFGWQPDDAGWLSCALQFAGTVLFNFNTFDAMHPGVEWWQQDLLIWMPNVVGSILFLASGYLAWIEVCHAHLAWQPGHISWCGCRQPCRLPGVYGLGPARFRSAPLAPFQRDDSFANIYPDRRHCVFHRCYLAVARGSRQPYRGRPGLT
jgi:hypothetical protein